MCLFFYPKESISREINTPINLTDQSKAISGQENTHTRKTRQGIALSKRRKKEKGKQVCHCEDGYKVT
jgi:hypothetical protein